MSNGATLKVDGVSLSFGGLKALDNVSITVEPDTIVGIIGPNGAGKTTLFNVITGVLRPRAGSVTFRGRDITTAVPETISRLGIARTYQKVRPFNRLTVIENTLVPIVNRDRWSGSMTEARQKARGLLSRVGLEAYAEAEAGTLNLFHRKKLELARALGAGAHLLLLDEVMAGLTPVECDDAVVLVQSLRSDFGLTIVCIEHLMRIVMSLSHRIVVLDRGRVIAEGTPAEVANNAQVQLAYFGADDA